MRLTQLAQDLVRARLGSRMIAVDATAGNGHDTLFLAQSVGPTGIVYAIDIQSASISATRQRIVDAGVDKSVVLIQASHDNWAAILSVEHYQKVDAVMMNLGYLPGGDQAIKTKPESTTKAIREAFDWLKPDGILTVLAYIGHPGGMEECAVVRSTFLEHLSSPDQLHEQPSRTGTNGPILFWCCCKSA
ncbi:MAG: methyltransferase domain-containing protein [Planctomycetota bacterium]|nr:methyltransferase domain-containing protein [Planctomycetota bacterium]